MGIEDTAGGINEAPVAGIVPMAISTVSQGQCKAAEQQSIFDRNYVDLKPNSPFPFLYNSVNDNCGPVSGSLPQCRIDPSFCTKEEFLDNERDGDDPMFLNEKSQSCLAY
ncbi:hypothetical protein CAPTEDRAFT_185889 [Capitella teleta]|uniref:Uncharacterized protein n=1 Tax=Capitella teleta TaxID=283909 RepID=R7TD70_CAPTE|nr:hypothetical protein CAPTEDRAFT_185889 [Capitella teleta]|eukprot:ELT91688.1 hypothetical protein CAPTEDRAFT_185889 [Capitella teleta]